MTLIAILLAFITTEVAGQVIFRNDFVIHGKKTKLENRGITRISINLDRYPNWNQLINGRGGRAVVIDVPALRRKHLQYSYYEVAERVYVPAQYTGPVVKPVPAFLLQVPANIKVPYFQFRGLGLIAPR